MGSFVGLRRNRAVDTLKLREDALAARSFTLDDTISYVATDLLWVDDDLAPRHPAARAAAHPRERARRIRARPGRCVHPPADHVVGRFLEGAGLQRPDLQGRQQPLPPGRGATRTGRSAGCRAADAPDGGTVGLCPRPRSHRPSAMRSSGSAGPTSWSASRASRTPRRSATSSARRRPASSSTSRTCARWWSTRTPGRPTARPRVVVETEPPDYVEQILLVRPTNRLQRVSLTYPEIDGVGGKGAALRTIFEIADALEVQALVVVDSDLRSIVPEWIELLAGPILKGGYDFVAPLYARYKYDGTITNTVTYPLTRALYGHRIRQPIGGDFGVSGDLVTPLPRARRLDPGHQPLRDRHLDDDLRASPAASRSARRASGPRSTTRRTRARTSGRCSARSSGTILRLADRYAGPVADDHAAATTSRPTASSGSSSRRRSR